MPAVIQSNHPETTVRSLGSNLQLADSPGLERKGSLLARNTALNLAGRVIPVLVNLAAIPYVVHHLGADRFGLLSLAWLVVGYFALFDLGIGPATTKFVAEFLGKGEVAKLPRLVWTAVVSQSCLGCAAAILLAVATPALVDRLLRIPPNLRSEALWVFLTLAVSLPVAFATGSLAGVLSAWQRFDLLNAVNIPFSCLGYALPCAALALGFGLRAGVFLLVLARLAAFLATLRLCVRVHPALIRHFGFDRSLIRPLLSFGGWVAVSGAVGPVLVYFERFLIGGLISVAAIGFYTPPYMISSKLGVLPSSLVATLFPAFSASAARGDREWIRSALVRSLKFLVLLVGPATLVMIFFARPVLTLWLGATFAVQGTLVLQILAAGVLLNSLALVPYHLLQGVGRPDLTAKFHLLELPLHIGLTWFLLLRFGLPGAALAWTIRVGLDLVLLIIAACRITQTSPRTLAGRDVGGSIATLVVLAVGFSALWGFSQALLMHVLLGFLLTFGFILGSWHFVLGVEEKWQIRAWLKTAR